MLWLIVGLLLVVLVAAGWFFLRQPALPMDRTAYRALVSLYVIRRRLELGQFKHELKRDAARLRRELDSELDKLNRHRL